MSFDVEAARARAAAIWTPENLAELARRRGSPGYGPAGHYPSADDIAWLTSLGVYTVPRRTAAPSLAELVRQARQGAS
jgi:hypothetical protein